MRLEDIREAIQRVPFKPFRINMTDGNSLSVVNRDFIMFAPSYRAINVYEVLSQRRYKQHLVDIMLINSLAFEEERLEVDNI